MPRPLVIEFGGSEEELMKFALRARGVYTNGVSEIDFVGHLA